MLASNSFLVTLHFALYLHCTAHQIRRKYKALEFIGFETGVFSLLTRQYMQERFNPKTLDADGARPAVST